MEDLKLIKDVNNIWDFIPLEPEYYKKICFQEFLLVGRFTPGTKSITPLGSLCLNIVNSVNHSKRLIVYLRSAFEIDGRQAGSKITSWLDPKLHTIEEKRTEFVEYCDPKKCSEPHSRQNLYVSLQKDHLHIHHTKESCRSNQENDYKLPRELVQNLICEASSFALMRILAQYKYIGQFETTTLYINGDLCRNIYLCRGPEAGEVNHKKMDICKIYRRIIEKCGVVHNCCTVLTTSGRIVSNEWQNSDYVFYLNPLADVSTLQEPSGPMDKIDGLKDLQLFSKYLDKKQLCIGKINNYMKEKNDIKTVLADYLQTILQMKPEDAVEFTMKYFVRFADAEWLK